MKKFVDIVMKALVVITILLALFTLFNKEAVKDFVAWIGVIVESFGKWNFLVIFLSSAIESFPIIGVVIPGQAILLLVGGFFAGTSPMNLFFVFLFAAFAAVLGNYVGYVLGRYYGDAFFKKYGLWFGIGETEVKYLKKSITKWGPLGIILGKFHGTTRSFIPFIAGSMGMKKKTFWIYNVLGSIVWAGAMVILGIMFAKSYELIIDFFGYIMMALFVVLGLYIYKFKKKEFMKYMEEKNAEIERKI